MDKTIQDPVHGLIRLPAEAVRVMDTPMFQRLRYLRQLATVHFVFPGATHTRFAHSIGTAHLARVLLDHLGVREEATRLEVILAALLHDVGHGPFSHAFDEVAARAKAPVHEERSAHIARRILTDIVPDVGALVNIDRVCNLILGRRIADDPSKAFLYDIVSNQDSGMDVDKLDYLQRDSYYAGIAHGINIDRIFAGARVGTLDSGRTVITYNRKVAPALARVYLTRLELHRAVYGHPVVRGIEHAITSAMVLAKIDPNFHVAPEEDMFKWTDDYVSMNAAYVRDIVTVVHRRDLPFRYVQRMNDAVRDEAMDADMHHFMCDEFVVRSGGEHFAHIWFHDKSGKHLTQALTEDIATMFPRDSTVRLFRYYVVRQR